MKQNTTDARTDAQKRTMAEHFAEMEATYRTEDWANIVYEDDHVVVVEDSKGYEFDEWASEFGDDFSQTMHDLAGQLVDRQWSASYPVVFDKIEGKQYMTDSECIHCGAVDEPSSDIEVRVEQNDQGEHYTVCNVCEPEE